MTEEKIMRSEVATFLNTTPSATATYSILGTGITDAAIQYNPQTSDETFINQDSGTTELESYKPTMPVEATAYNGNAAFEFVDALRKARAVGAAAYSDIVNVWLYETAVSGAYPAEKQNVSIQVDSFGGAGGEGAKISFTLNYRGNAVAGTYNPTTGVFVANPSVARLTSLALGGLTLTPAFDGSWVLYTAPTTNATNTITAASTVSGATVVILNGSTPVTSGASATWSAGVNHVTITVSVSGEDDGVYHIDVTYTA